MISEVTMKVAVVCGCKQNLGHIRGSVGYWWLPNKIQNSTISNHIARILSEVNAKSFDSVKLHQLDG